MKKAYVYKVCANGRVSADLQTAICNAVDDMVEKNYIGDRSSQPITVKCYGGYKVMLFDNDGKMYFRRIDVFVPDAVEIAKPFMVDECYEVPEMLTEDAMYGDKDEDEEDYDYDDEDDYVVCSRCGELVPESEGDYIGAEFVCDDCLEDEDYDEDSDDCEDYMSCDDCPHADKDGNCTL